MNGQQAAFPEKFDDVLAVVNETPRGRWFLETFSNRLKSNNTSTILEAIAKLESNLQSMSSSGADATLLAKAREAIQTARQDIANLELAPSELSAEGQLFAKLADLSRKAFSGSASEAPAVTKGVERALRLVADLDRDLGSTVVAIGQTAAKPAVKYFNQDEEIFEPAPQPTIKKIEKPAPIVETVAKGAKLVIHRIGQTIEKPAEVLDVKETNSSAVELPASNSNDNPAQLVNKEIEPARITIIRRKIDETVDVPLMEHSSIPSESAA